MSNPSNQSSTRASGVRALTIILLGLFFVAAEIFMLFQDKNKSFQNESLISTQGRIPEAIQEKVTVKKLVYSLSEEELEPELLEIPGAGEANPKKLGYDFGIEDVTGQGNVRASNLKIGVDYKVSENSTVGVEARQGVHDTQDAAAWGASMDDETAARAKYKLSF